MAQAAAKTVDLVTFYAWIENQSSSMTIHISGGEMEKDPISGKIRALGHKEVKFNMGIYRSKDPEIVKELRRLIDAGETITEDKEVYLSHVEPPKRREERMAKNNQALKATNAQLETEIAELKAKLNGKG